MKGAGWGGGGSELLGLGGISRFDSLRPFSLSLRCLGGQRLYRLMRKCVIVCLTCCRRGVWGWESAAPCYGRVACACAVRRWRTGSVTMATSKGVRQSGKSKSSVASQTVTASPPKLRMMMQFGDSEVRGVGIRGCRVAAPAKQGGPVWSAKIACATPFRASHVQVTLRHADVARTRVSVGVWAACRCGMCGCWQVVMGPLIGRGATAVVRRGTCQRAP